MVTPTKALLEELHIHGQRPEAIRTHAASRFLFAEAPEEKIILGRVRHGKGWVYLDVFRRPGESHARLRRYESIFFRNLGGKLSVDALCGDSVPRAVSFSSGFPRQILTQPVLESSLREKLARNTALPAERMAPSSMFRIGSWSILENEEGKWAGPGDGEIALFTCLHTPRARRVVMEDSGIPNPESLTFLDVKAPGGSLELVLNGESRGTQSLASGTTNFSDLELFQAYNQVLLLWNSPKGSGSLKFRFRTIQRQPETEFFFLTANADATQWQQTEF